MTCNGNGSVYSGFLDLPNASGDQLQSFAVDSAGHGWLSVYGSSPYGLRLCSEIDAAFNVVAVPIPDSTVTRRPTDVELSISWGSRTRGRSAVRLQLRHPPHPCYRTGRLPSADGGDVAYRQLQPQGPSSTTRIWTASSSPSFNGPYGLIRVARDWTLLEGIDVGLTESGRHTYSVFTLAVDGQGHVAVQTVLPTAAFTGYALRLYAGTQLLFNISAGGGTAHRRPVSAQLIYTLHFSAVFVPHDGVPPVEAYSYAGLLVRSIPRVCWAVRTTTSLRFWNRRHRGRRCWAATTTAGTGQSGVHRRGDGQRDVNLLQLNSSLYQRL